MSSFMYSSKRFADIEVIDCLNLTEFLYRPYLDEKLRGDPIWSLLSLKKLKLNCSQKFMRNLKNLRTLIIARFESADKDLLNELPKLKLLDVHEIDFSLFGQINEEYGEKLQVSYRGLPSQYVQNRPRIQNQSQIKTNGRSFGIRLDDSRTVWDFKKDDLEMYRGQVEKTNDEIHFYRSFNIFDSCKQIERSFFRKFVDVYQLFIFKNTLNQAALLSILDSFPNVESILF